MDKPRLSDLANKSFVMDTFASTVAKWYPGTPIDRCAVSPRVAVIGALVDKPELKDEVYACLEYCCES